MSYYGILEERLLKIVVYLRYHVYVLMDGVEIIVQLISIVVPISPAMKM